MIKFLLDFDKYIYKGDLIMPRKKKELVNDVVVLSGNDTLTSSSDVDSSASDLNLSEPVVKRISNAPKVNVRACPSGDILTQLPSGTHVLVESESDGWCKITGYVMSSLISEL